MKLSSLSSVLLAISHVWGQEWSIVPDSTATTLVGVGVSSNTLAVGAAAQNGVGAYFDRYDSGVWYKDQVPGGLLMDSAISESVIVGASMMPIIISTDGGKTYTTAENIGGVCQSTTVFGPDGKDIGLVGYFHQTPGSPYVYGVAHSPDAGQSWEVFEVPVGMTRYGSFPSQNTWYVTSGTWGDSLTSQLKNTTSHSLNSNLRVSSNGINIELFNGQASGYWGAISKTTDGGETWETVFTSEASDAYYFNAIDCSSELHCVAVTEGQTVDDFHAFVTFDGGATWTDSLVESPIPSNTVSFTSAAWKDDMEGWVAGAVQNGRSLSGLFMKTSDGGKTFSVEQNLENCLVMDMDFGDDLGVAACVSSTGSSCSMAWYK